MMSKQFTRWFKPSEKPVRVGEYNASMVKDKDILRWWDGSSWSLAYLRTDYRKTVDICRKSKMHGSNFTIYWRGFTTEQK